MVGGMSVILEIDYEKCTGCGECVSKCPNKAVSLVNGRPVLVLPGNCNYCTECEQFCTSGAIRAPFEILMADSSVNGNFSGLLPAVLAVSATSFLTVYASFPYSAA